MAILEKLKKGQSNKPPRIMMIGVEGVGKSTAGAAMPNPVFLCGEDGLVGDQFNDVYSFTPSSWAEVLAFCDELAAANTEFKSIVIDTLDWIEPLLAKAVCEKYGQGKIHNIEEFSFGKGYALAQQEARHLLVKMDKLNSIGFSILILAHSQIKNFKNPVGDDFDRYEPKVNGKIVSVFKEWCNAVLFAQFDMYTAKESKRGKAKAYGGQNRIVQTTHNAAWDAKNRYGLPDTMPFDMKEIMNAINNTQPIDVEPLIEELKGYIAEMDEKAAAKWNKWLEGKPTAQTIAEKLNTLRVKKNLNKTEEKEA